MKKVLAVVGIVCSIFFIVACSSTAPAELTTTAEFENMTLNLSGAEIVTNERNEKILKVSAVYTNNNSDPYYALCSFGVKVFQNDIEQEDISDINGEEHILIQEIKDGQSLNVGYSFRLTNETPVEIYVHTPTADEVLIAKMIYPEPQPEEE